MSLYARFDYDKNLADSGTWVPFGEGIEFKMRRMSSSVVQDKRRQLEQPYEALTRTGGALSDDLHREIIRNLLAEAVILEWKGVTDREGKEMPFSINNVKTLLTDLPDLVRVLVDLAMDRDNFKTKTDEAVAGNSVASSGKV